MAYRFLLEVPEPLATEASVAVEQASDAQVILVRDSHGLGFDDPYVDLTIAAHTLRVVDPLYGWFETLGASRPDVRIVLHGGERLALQAQDRGGMVAAIRRDQPWVERTIPKVGEHEEEHVTVDVSARTARDEGSISGVGSQVPAVAAGLDASWVAPGSNAARAPERRMKLRGLNHVAIQIADLAKAERFYAEFFGMELTGRARRGARGAFDAIDGDYRWDDAVRSGTEADVSFVSGGDLSLALHRAGRGARIERGVLDHLSVSVDASSFATMKGEVLLRPLTVLRSSDASFTFRDPFGVVWEVSVRGTRPNPIG
jgi:catechol 2,3-dioxygenase-like lactoylglutathione lyase family enzyme